MTPPDTAGPEQKKVLVVDDETVVRTLIRTKLSRCGFTVLEATNGLEAVEMARTLYPDIILMDVMMPKMNGFEACEKLRSNPDTARIPVLMLTARGEETDQEKGKTAGATSYLSKPFSPQKLVDLVIDILQNHPRL